MQLSTCRLRALANGIGALHGEVLTHVINCVNPDAFDDRRYEEHKATLFRGGAGILDGGY